MFTSGYNKLISLGAGVALAGFLLSGPVGFVIVQWTNPQPPWVSAAVFSAGYHVVQDLPYYFGFLLIGGMIMLAAGHYLNYSGDNRQTKFHLLVALCWTIIFASLIFFNYICQTTFVRHLAMDYKPEYDGFIATFSMANPMSLSWSIEMWGYGYLGVANWLMSSYYLNRNDLIRVLLITNGVMSLAGVGLTIVDIQWVLTGVGLIAYTIWNLLMIIILMLIWRFNNREDQRMAA